MQSLKLEIKGELTDLNTYIQAERTHRQKAAKIKKADTDAVMWLCWQQLKGKKIDRPVDVYIKWYTKNAKKDPDNVAFAKKFIMDGLVKAEILPQDSRKWIKSFFDEFHTDKDDPRIEVVLEEAL